MADPGPWFNQGQVIKIDPASGAQTVIARVWLSHATMGGGIAVEPGGTVLIAADSNELIRVNPATGEQTTISQGGLLATINCIAVNSAGEIFVGQSEGNGGTSKVIKVNPSTGAQSVVTSGGYLTDYQGPNGIAIDSDGNLVVEFEAWYSNGIVKVAPDTGAQTLILNGLAGTLSFWPYDVAVEPAGAYLSVGEGGWAGSSQIVRVDPASGAWTIASSGFVNAAGIAVVPNRYKFIGYLTPILNDGSSFFRVGRTIPVKFQLAGADGALVTNAVATLQVRLVSATASGTTDMTDATSSGASNTDNRFRFDPTTNQYVYNFSTTGFAVGTYRLCTTLDDGSTHDVLISLR